MRRVIFFTPNGIYIGKKTIRENEYGGFSMKVFILTRKRLAALGAALALIVCFGVVGSHRNDIAVAVNAGARSIPIYSVKTDEKKVSLSFDAAWGNEQTQSLLDILGKYKVKSTFFLVGDWVRTYPDDVKKIAQAGHDVGNHSDTHPYMTQLDGDSIKSQIENCSSEVEKLTGKKPTLFRPPYGDYDNSVVDTVNSLGMYCVQWSIDSLDWQDPSPEEILAKVEKNLAPGAIILMHNGAKNTPAALPSVIEYIQSQGYEIVPISELLPEGSYTTDANGAMICGDGESAVKTAAEVDTRSAALSSDTASAAVSSTASASGAASAASSAVSAETPSIASSGASSKTASMTSSTASSAMKKETQRSGATSSRYSGLAAEMYDGTSSKKKQ